MQAVELFREAGWVAYVQVFVCALGLLWTLVCATLLGLRWKVPPFLAAGALGLPALIAAVGASASSRNIEAAIRMVDPSQRSAVYAQGVAELLGGSIFVITVLPAALLLGIGAAAGGARAPRGYGAAVLSFLLLAFASLLPIGGFFYGAGAGPIAAKVLLYGIGVIPVTASMINNGLDTNGRETSVSAAIAWLTVVAALEVSTSASGWMEVFAAIANSDPNQRGRLVAEAQLMLDGPARLGWASFLIGLGVMLLAAFRPMRQPTEEEILAGKFNPSPWRGFSVLLSFAVPVLWMIALLSCDPTSMLERLIGGK